MHDKHGIERGECALCRSQHLECMEFICVPENKEETTWEDRTAKEYAANPILGYIQKYLEDSEVAPLTDLCTCGCDASEHEAVEISKQEATMLHKVRNHLSNIDMSMCVSQSVHDTQHLSKSRKSFTYGEVNMPQFIRLLDLAMALQKARGLYRKNGIFVDLGCGLGKPVFLASLHSYGFAVSRGVELLPGLHRIAETMGKRWPEKVEFQCGDLLNVEMGDVDVAYIASTCFDDRMMRKIANSLTEKGFHGLVITLRTPIPGYQELWSSWIPMSWGRAEAFMSVPKTPCEIDAVAEKCPKQLASTER